MIVVIEVLNIFVNKKVLLREHKRHTARRVASARFADWGGVPHPILDGGGVPSTPRPRSGWRGTPSNLGRGACPRSGRGGGGYPIQSWTGGYPPSAEWDTPNQTWDGVPPIQTWDGVPPQSRPGMGYPPSPDLGWGTPHPDLGWDTPPVQTWDGVPPCLNLGWGTPPPSRPDMGYPSPVQTWDGVPPKSWTDTHLWKHNLPSYVLRTRAVIILMQRSSVVIDCLIEPNSLKTVPVIRLFSIFQAFMKAKLSPKDVPPASPEPMADIREEKHEDQADSDNDSVSLEDDAFKCKYLVAINPVVLVSVDILHIFELNSLTTSTWG